MFAPIIAILAAIALLLGLGSPTYPHTTSLPDPPDRAFCDPLGPYLKDISATITTYPDGAQVLTVKCYID